MYTAWIRSAGRPVRGDAFLLRVAGRDSRGESTGSSWSTSSGYLIWTSRTTLGQNDEMSGAGPW